MTLEAEPVSPGEALSGKLSGKLLLLCYHKSTVHACMRYVIRLAVR